jgi:hypothetical protein
MRSTHARAISITRGNLPPSRHLQRPIAIFNEIAIINFVRVQRHVQVANDEVTLRGKEGLVCWCVRVMHSKPPWSGRMRAYVLTSIKLTSHPEAATASKPNPPTHDRTSYPAELAVATSQPAALASTAVKPKNLMAVQSHPAALKAATL